MKSIQRISRAITSAWKYIAVEGYRIRNNDVSLISCDCFGGVVYDWYNLKFNSPTINLHIYPEQFDKFCENLKYYLSLDIQKVTTFTDKQRQMIFHLYKRQPEELKFNFGLCGDILIGFVHYTSFDDAVRCWNRRRERVNYDNCKYILRIEDDSYSEDGERFDRLDLPNNSKIIFTVNCTFKAKNTLTVPVAVPAGKIWLDRVSRFRHYYEEKIHIIDWLNS